MRVHPETYLKADKTWNVGDLGLLKYGELFLLDFLYRINFTSIQFAKFHKLSVNPFYTLTNTPPNIIQHFSATPDQEKIHLNFAKSFVQSSLSRAAVDFLLYRMNLTGIIEKIHGNAPLIDGFAMTKDELLIGTLNAEDWLHFPGGFTQHCLNQGVEINGLTR